MKEKEKPMTTKSYYNARFDCYINFDQENHLTFILDNVKFPIEQAKPVDSGIQQVESSQTKDERTIEGLLIPYRNHISFTGHLSELGFVAAEFEPVS